MCVKQGGGDDDTKNVPKITKFVIAERYQYLGPMFYNPLGTSKLLNFKGELSIIVQQ